MGRYVINTNNRPTPLIALRPIDVGLVLKGVPEQHTVKLRLQGAEMYMGEIRSTLSPKT